MSQSDSNHRTAKGVSPMTEQQRRTQVTRWVAWHAAELVALGVPAVLAITVSAWFWAVVVLAGAGWVVHELRQHRHVHTLRTALHQQQLTTTETESPSAPAGETRENA